MSETLMAADPIAGERTKTYRGASIEELLPRIRADLGPEAVIVSRREGLIGGFAGFFQKRCIEIDARPGGPRIDVYDDGDAAVDLDGPVEIASETAPAPVDIAAETALPPIPTDPHPVRNDAATREGLATPAMQRLVGEAKPFADLLGEMTTEPAPAPNPYAEAQRSAPDADADPEVEESTPEPRRIAALREGMVQRAGADARREPRQPTLLESVPVA